MCISNRVLSGDVAGLGLAWFEARGTVDEIRIWSAGEMRDCLTRQRDQLDRKMGGETDRVREVKSQCEGDTSTFLERRHMHAKALVRWVLLC